MPTVASSTTVLGFRVWIYRLAPIWRTSLVVEELASPTMRASRSSLEVGANPVILTSAVVEDANVPTIRASQFVEDES